MLTKEYPHKEI
ncbi:hypothetical protein CGLO_15743 [Colletotrichum gloeosporioides Cg-14]|uniref:Uncharacterized protein n=1 Tax=Colletotrichum gloeosporioides (strain Cg-14) TaxID=1237896 RepID=T0LAS4_COLGC|nr:hypothetical protein CGLO_15743 [Colletotrichum gloeosporioides Cg-14]